ncbi:hypothetical protein HYC85_028644 [Camellia sinensis]|uniref:Uncharacterized protein n=1 Tax=Camellia sinensis TaxID=4442 RepID=A0A7J7FVR5_CAMSI|nr:hypothetical protein HYC85_028644 [Camellia sinensis]
MTVQVLRTVKNRVSTQSMIARYDDNQSIPKIASKLHMTITQMQKEVGNRQPATSMSQP